MAYLDITSSYTTPQAGTAATQPVIELSSLEWSVVALARRDTLGSLDTPGRIGRALRKALGIGRSLMLADPRLEALRRLAVHAWHRGYAVPSAEIKRLLGAGYTIGQVETLLGTIAGERQASRRRTVR